MVERESGKFYVEIVEKGNVKTLLPIIQKFVSVEVSSIISEWRAYNGSKNLNYRHRKIKHKETFVDPEYSLIHTQTIENRWGQVKAMMKKRGKVPRTSFPKKSSGNSLENYEQQRYSI